MIGRSILIGISSMVIVLAALLPPLVQAQSSDSAKRDCDDNAVLRCGAYSTSEINQKYASQAGAKTIFHHFGISSTEVNSLHDNAVSGYVTKGGRVLVDGKTVATDAVTAGRQNMPGSQKVTRNGTTFYTRPPSASFNEDKLDAYVVMKNGVFQYAIIKSCGNPVMAKPVEKPKPAPQPAQPQTPPPAPAPVKPAAPAPVPSSAECRLINVERRDNRQVSVTTNTVATNAQITSYIIDFGDGTVENKPAANSSATTTASTTGSTSSTVNNANSPAVIHQYAQDGTYTIKASVQVRHHDGRTETVTSQSCQATVAFNPPVTPAQTAPAPPPSPKEAPPAPAPAALPATGFGVGEAAGLSAATGIASSMGYGLYVFLRSRFYLV